MNKGEWFDYQTAAACWPGSSHVLAWSRTCDENTWEWDGLISWKACLLAVIPLYMDITEGIHTYCERNTIIGMVGRNRDPGHSPRNNAEAPHTAPTLPHEEMPLAFKI